ncbi:AraC family transcriptional regulator [Paenibacillus sp. SYP-B4298]|uniref:AraC family transcriptional regulator n=1 Tax=Paenibacillus sp. SYP-B4298 TaxID=2996034 RepID=UPI0022DD5561|nr:AraC family transcriptional regulator [Paenibacillus sp. SYP-B4298]
MADVYKLAEQFGEAAIAIDDIYKFIVEPGAVMRNYVTEKNGFIITTKGNATVDFNDSLYHLSPGVIVHGAPDMTINANVTSPTSWEYYLILYGLGEGMPRKDAEIYTHFELNTGVNSRIQELLQIMKSTTDSSDRMRYLRAKSLFFDVLYEVFVSSQYCIYRKSQQASVVEAQQFIRSHFAEHLSLGELAALHGMTAGNFSYLFHKYFGIRPMDYLTQCRMNQAKQLLAATDLPVQEISAQVGYSDPMYFSRVFKKHTGTSPSRFPSRARSGLHIRP